MQPLVEVTGITKSFGTTRALRGVNLSVAPGEVHGLIGANGAGKSTLVNCIAGRIEPDAGVIAVDGEAVHITGPQHANQLGLTFIFQELAFAGRMSVLKNLGLGRWRATRFGFVDWKALRARAQVVADRLGFDFELDAPVRTLSVAQRGVLSIARALMQDARLIAMDEPTASLSSAECERLFKIIEELRADGVGIIYISHRLKEIEALCDRVTVFKDGADIGVFERGEFTEDSLVELMAGAAVIAPAPRRGAVNSGEVVLQVRELSRPPYFESISFDLHRGEILGLGGLVGAGRTEILRAIFGADAVSAGSVSVAGKILTLGSISDAIGAGIALVPEERRSQGLAMRKSVEWNIALPSLPQLRRRWSPLTSKSMIRARAEEFATALAIKTASLSTPVMNLSGGNQQKVVLAKWLSRRPRILLLDEPSRGVDVPSRREIFGVVRRMASDGVSVVLVSSELEELEVCDRVLVLREGRIVGELTDQDGISESSILNIALKNQEV